MLLQIFTGDNMKFPEVRDIVIQDHYKYFYSDESIFHKFSSTYLVF